MKPLSKRSAIWSTLVLIMVAACQLRTAPTAPPAPAAALPTDFPIQFYANEPADAVYRVVPARSSLIVKVYRAGPLAALGHNHVVTNASTDGYVYLADDLANARADLFVPVDSFVVDDPTARAAAGLDFATQPTASEIAGTREHMLGSALLDGAAFPYIRVHVAPLSVGERSTRVNASIEVRGKTATLPVDVDWRRTGGELSIVAQFSVDHATLGLAPYSALGGALRVADSIDVSIALVAVSPAR
jgi:polyisoprenoid-binding protein YceI